MEIEVEGRKWTVLKVYEKKQKEKDLFLCENKYHVKECFQRCDFEGCECIRTTKKPMTEEIKKQIEAEVQKKTPRREIFTKFSDYHQYKINRIISITRMKLGYREHEPYDIRGNRKAVLQYDLDGNFIARYDSCYAAAKAVGVNQKLLWYSINERKTPKDYIWRYEEDDQFKREG